MFATASLRAGASELHQNAHIPFARRVDATTVLSDSGDLMTTWRVAGLAFESRSIESLGAALDALNVAIRSLANGTYSFWIHRVRRRVSDGMSLPQQPFAKQVLEQYYRAMRNRGLIRMELYVTLIYRPAPQRNLNVFGSTAKNSQALQRARAAAREVLADAARLLEAALLDYQPCRLEDYWQEGRLWSAQLEFYAFLVNVEWGRVAVKDVPLWSYLPINRKLFGNEVIEIRGLAGARYASFLDLQDYADQSTPGILNPLLRLDAEFIETHSFSPMPRLAAAASLKRRQRQLASVEDDGVSQQSEIAQALDELSAGRFALGSYHFSLMILSDSALDLKAKRVAAAELLQKAGFRPAPIDLVIDAAFWAQLPGNWRYRPRIAELSSRNFLGLASLHSFNVGKRVGNPWGEALAIMTCPSGEPFYFNCHATEFDQDSTGEMALASTHIVGQSGEGKTVLAGFIGLSLAKYGAELVWFDKDHSAELLIRAIGGSYQTLRRGRASGLAPFKREAHDAEVLHWIDLVTLCATPEHRTLVPQELIDLEKAVRGAAVLPAELRGFGAVLQNLPKSKEDELYTRLSRWAASHDGPLAWALDNEVDAIGFDGATAHGFDYTDLLDDAEALAPMMSHLLYRIEQRLDGRRFVYVMEEYWRVLQNPHFEAFAKDKQKTIRKKNGFGIYLTQSPSDTLQQRIARTLIEQTATFIFLPNPSADRDDYVKGFKLTEAEFEVVRSLPRGSHLMLVKQGTSTSVCRLDLAGMRQALAVLSATPVQIERATQLRAVLGEDPACWLDTFLSEV
jgi:type IV secretion system protein VirB4